MDQATLRAFAARVNEGDLGPDVQVRYRVAGGMPSQRLESEVVVDSVNGARVSRYDAQRSETATRFAVPPDEIDVPRLLRSVIRSLPALTPTEERVTRRPDSVLGRLTVVVEGAEESFHVVPPPGRPDEPSTSDWALQRLWDLATGEHHPHGGDRGA